MVNTLKPLFLVAVLAAAAYGVFTIMGGGAPSKPPVELDDWGGGPTAGGPAMPPPLSAPPGATEPAGMATNTTEAPPYASAGGDAPPYDPGTSATSAPPFQPLGEAPAPEYNNDAAANSTTSIAPPLPGDVGDNSATGQPPLTDSPTTLAPPGSPGASSDVATTPYGQPDAYGNVTPQMNDYDTGNDATTQQPTGGSTNEQGASDGFAVALATIKAQLEQQQIAEAQLALSQWYGDPSLTPAEEEQLLTLLDQLTGTVIYSRQHLLEEAYVTSQGETLEAIAGQYSVPAELLAHINGVSATGPMPAGQELKVVRGPFAASLDLDKYRFTLWLGERYAGRFAVGLGSEQPITPGDYVVETKINDPTYYGSELTIAKDDPTNPLGEYWIGLGGNFGLHGTVDPQSVGGPAKEGCVRLTDRDIKDVFDILSIGSRVIVHHSADTSGMDSNAQASEPQAPTAQAPAYPPPTAQTPAPPGATARF